MMKIKELISEEKLQKRVKELSEKIEKDYEDKEINFVCTLKGAIFFMTDLARYINKNVKIHFVKVSSYDGMESKDVKMKANLLENIMDKDIIIVEDIVDTGKTINYLVNYLKDMGAKSIKVCTILDKPIKRSINFKPEYVGFEIEDKFVIGYGLDFNQDYRNLPYIGYIDDDTKNIQTKKIN